ncbi:hypothetical protein Hanom_Chr12g01066551 [Helianthus anomalus]
MLLFSGKGESVTRSCRTFGDSPNPNSVIGDFSGGVLLQLNSYASGATTVLWMLLGRQVSVWWSRSRFPMAFPAILVDLFSSMWSSNHGMFFDPFFSM